MNLAQSYYQHKLFDLLAHAIECGTLHVRTPAGETRSFTGSKPGHEAEWRIHDWSLVRALADRGDIGLGETYVAGLWDADNLDTLFCVFVDNLDALDQYANGSKLSQMWFKLVNHVFRRNSVRGSRSNISAHYDVGNPFYRLWLDRSMTYSSAIYTDPSASLEAAQAEKYKRILDRIGDAREHVLEVGCGWGGFAEAAVARGHQLTGLTVSPKQHAFASERLKQTAADIRLEDYRHTQGMFDALASIEMFEAVGRQYWPAYFNTIKQRMASDGIAMVQTITIRDEYFEDYANRGDYIRHYVFPGGLLPSIEAFRKSAERAGLVCKDIYLFGQDYARTLREWIKRFDLNEANIRAMGYDNAFIRSWRLYMCMCAASFTGERTNVMQVELAHA